MAEEIKNNSLELSISDQVTNTCETEKEQIDKNYVGMQTISFAKLLPAEGEFQKHSVRPINKNRVDERTQIFLAQQRREISSQLTVMEVDDGFAILDGNHRFKAMWKIREKEIDWFENVPCRVYKPLKSQQALAIAYGCNHDSEDVLKMSDFEKVKVVRSILDSTGYNEDCFDKVYEMLSVNTVSLISLEFVSL